MPCEEQQVRTPLIFEIKGNSLDDGPGIRSVIFFKGCPLSCSWCHNPEGRRTQGEIGYDRKECISCGTCAALCPAGAVFPDSVHFIDRTKCTLCFQCVDACPSGALSRVGREMTVEEIVEDVLRDKPFFDTSGGGVTFSGGEPALFMEFLSDLLKRLKNLRIHTLLETSGLFDFEKFEKLLLPWLDMIYYDIKMMDSDAHRRHTGVPNQRILDNFERLSQTGVSFLPRTPLVPGITDTSDNILAIAGYFAKLHIKSVALLSYNPLWHDKMSKIGSDSPYRSDKHMTSWMEPKSLERCRNIFRDEGIAVV